MLYSNRVSSDKTSSASEQMEVEIDGTIQLQNSSQSEQVQSSDSSIKEISQVERQSIAISRMRRQIKPSQRYRYEDLVVYALSVAHDTEEDGKPSTYNQAISNVSSVE